MASSLPTYTPFGKAFANSAAITDVSVPGAASSDSVPNFATGFPTVYSTPLSEGGKYFERKDMNGLGRVLSAFQAYLQAGGYVTFNTTVAGSNWLNGYPQGAILGGLDPNGNFRFVKSTMNNNTNDFRSVTTNWPGTGWEVVTPSLAELTAHTSNSTIHVTASDKTNWNAKANDDAVVKLTGDQAIAGKKTFSTTPAVGTLSDDNDSTSAASTAWVRARIDNWWLANGGDYLERSGGEMTGDIEFSNGKVKRKTDTSSMVVQGGSTDSDGGSLEVYGKSHTTAPGKFNLTAKNGSSAVKSLVGSPDGALTWNGSEIVRSINDQTATSGTGAVTLTPSDVGAVNKSGDNMTGNLQVNGKSVVRSINSVDADTSGNVDLSNVCVTSVNGQKGAVTTFKIVSSPSEITEENVLYFIDG